MSSPIPPPTRLVQGLLARWRSLHSRTLVAIARAAGARIGRGAVLGRGCDLQLGFEPARRGRISVADNCHLGAGVILHPYEGEIVLRKGVHLGPGVVIYGHGGVIIGEHSLVAMHCRILSSEHVIAPEGVYVRSLPSRPLPTRLGRDVWLGAGVTVLGGVTVGDGCVVGAGAVVTRDLAPFSIAVGVPARVVGRRPPPE